MESKAKKPQAGGKQPSADVAALQQQVQELQEQLKKLTDIAGRAQADLQNAKARLERSADDLRKYAAEDVLRRLLPVIDNFQRAFQHLPDGLKSNDWVKGVAAIEQELIKQVSDLGLQKIDARGKPVDPARHDVLMQGPGEEGVVTEVFEEGYELYGKVLRPAKVQVGNGETQS